MKLKLFITSLLLSLGLLGATANAGIISYEVDGSTDGNQSYSGILGMDFIVNQSISISHLGVFDDDSNGLSLDITAELWSRNDGGTPLNPFDDTSGSKLLSHVFSGTNETLIGGSRFFELSTPEILGPGAYTILAYGYGTEENGNAGNPSVPKTWSTNDGGGALSFVGCSRFGGIQGSSIGVNVDTNVRCGPVDRYAAGTFIYAVSEPSIIALMSAGLIGLGFMRRRKHLV